MNRRKATLLLIAGVLAGIVLSWCYGDMARARGAAKRAAADLVECGRMAAAIENRSRQPAKASEHEQLAAETTGLIETAAKDADIELHSLIRISPEPPRRLGDTVYKEKPTQVFLKDITLKQLVGLVHNLLTSKNNLEVKALRLAAPRPDDTADNWTAELVLTYLIYDPPGKQQ